MGIFIRTYISNSVTQEEWDPVYEKSLLMAKKLGFYDLAYKTIHGERLGCICPVEETIDEERPSFSGWSAVGSLPSYKRAETQFTHKYVNGKTSPTTKFDALESFISFFRGCGDFNEPVWEIWGCKTQGEPYHMGLLAIGCMIEQELGIQAVVEGDITYGQCRNAVKLASEILETEVQLPICCRLDDLCKRVNKFERLSEIEKIEFLCEYYLGEKNAEFGEFIRKNFSDEVITAYWQKRFHGYKDYMDTYVFNSSSKEFLSQGFSLNKYCELVEFDRTDPKNCQKLIENIMETSMHIKEKDCEDVLDYKRSDEPYDIHWMLASVVMGSASNPAIDRYIPIDEIRATFKKHFGNIVNVDEIIDNYLQKEKESEEKKPHEVLKEAIKDRADALQEERDNYDICYYSDLPYYKKGSSFDPILADSIKKSFKFYCGLLNNEEYEELKAKSGEELFHFLASIFRRRGLFFLQEKHWEKIYQSLLQDTGCFSRYYPMIRVVAEGDLEYLVRAFVTNDDFWSYCCDNFSDNE